MLCGLALGCSPTDPASPAPSSTSPFPAVLMIEGRGNPPLTIVIGTFEAARIPCDGGGEVTPGEAGVPPLPWDLRMVTQADGQVLLSSHVTELPRWLVVIGTDAGIGSIPVAGPPGPSCPPGP